jgi:hypothetical protein
VKIRYSFFDETRQRPAGNENFRTKNDPGRPKKQSAHRSVSIFGIRATQQTAKRAWSGLAQPNPTSKLISFIRYGMAVFQHSPAVAAEYILLAGAGCPEYSGYIWPGMNVGVTLR